MENDTTGLRAMCDAPRDGRWITLFRKDGQKRRAAWIVPVWTIFRDPTKPAWITDDFKFADPFDDAIGWMP